MRKITILVISALFCAGAQGQLNKFGSPIVKHYSSEITTGSDQNWWVTKDKFGAVYFANNDRGVIRYDGTSWTSIPVRREARVRALGSDKNGIVYVGGTYEFGFIEPDTAGSPTYISLSKRYEKSGTDTTLVNENPGGVNESTEEVYIGEIVSLAVDDSLVYYLSDEALFIYNIRSQELLNINLREQGFREFTRIHKINDRLFLTENLSGIFEFKDGKVVEVPGGKKFEGMICLSLLPVSEDELLVCTYKNGLILLNYKTGIINDKWVEPSANSKIRQVYCGAKLASGEFIIGTINGDGIYVLDSKGKLEAIWNTETGVLDDNLILALYSDSVTNELWVSVTGSLSKIYTDLPYTVFSQDQGINDVVVGINELGGVFYASTDGGIYKSHSDEYGTPHFSDIEDISDQTFPLIKATVDNETFLVAGTILGVYQIKENGSVVNIGERITEHNNSILSTFSAFSILQSKTDPHVFYLGSSGEGLIKIEYRNRIWNMAGNKLMVQGNIIHQAEADNGDLFIVADYPSRIYRVPANDTVALKYEGSKALPASIIACVSRIDNDIVVSTNNGLFKYNIKSDDWTPFNEVTNGYSSGKKVNVFYQDGEGDLWVEFNEGREVLMLFKRSDGNILSYRAPYLVLPNAKMVFPKEISGRVWLGKSKNIFVMNKELLKITPDTPVTMLSRILIGGDSTLLNGTFYTTLENGRKIPQLSNKGLSIPEIKYNLNSLSFYWTTPSYIYEDATRYSYKLEGFSDEWSRWEAIHYKDFTNLPFGKYTFRVKALTGTGIETQEASFEFIVLRPWYFTTVMIIVYSIVVILIIFVIIAAYTRKLKNENLRLESIIAERTKVVVKQKEELESSIHYASRIQMALLPSEAILSENLKNYFILFRPRDIVSGDFYWMTKKANRLYIVAADCTGHGVPGAFMSLLGMSFLDEIIDKDTTPRADIILNELRHHVTDSLKQSGTDNEAKDGMDMSLLVIDFNVSMIEFSGAYNPCFRVRKLTPEEVRRHKEENVELADGTMTNGKYLLETIFASKMPIGISSRMDEKFIFHDWKLEKGVSYYLFSDGYIDQFGGPLGRKFMKKNFKRLILEIQDYPMSKQKDIMEKSLRDWMGKTPQIDDILVMGIRTD